MLQYILLKFRGILQHDYAVYILIARTVDRCVNSFTRRKCHDLWLRHHLIVDSNFTFARVSWVPAYMRFSRPAAGVTGICGSLRPGSTSGDRIRGWRITDGGKNHQEWCQILRVSSRKRTVAQVRWTNWTCSRRSIFMRFCSAHVRQIVWVIREYTSEIVGILLGCTAVVASTSKAHTVHRGKQLVTLWSARSFYPVTRASWGSLLTFALSFHDTMSFPGLSTAGGVRIASSVLSCTGVNHLEPNF